MEKYSFEYLVWAWIVLALVLFPIQLKITAPYGRHTKKSWGLLMDNRLGWMLMEIISPIVFACFFLLGEVSSKVNVLFFVIWMIHYFNRSIIFPLRTKTSGKKIPVMIVASAVFFNVVNAGINGYYFGFVESYDMSLFSTTHFRCGAILFVLGLMINLQSDEILLSLRKGKDQGYKIPYGGLFHWISCPNHFGEIVEWTGFAMMAWSLPAWSFAIWTAANLIPRAVSHHRWYKQHFRDYPKDRKTVIPFVL